MELTLFWYRSDDGSYDAKLGDTTFVIVKQDDGWRWQVTVLEGGEHKPRGSGRGLASSDDAKQAAADCFIKLKGYRVRG